MKQDLVFIHGGNAYSQYDDFLDSLQHSDIRDPLGSEPDRWSKKLPQSLGADFNVYCPQMPSKTNAKYSEWQIWFERYLNFVENPLVLVGWSLGGLFLAKYLSENELLQPGKALYILAAPFKRDSLEGEDCGDFWFDLEKLPRAAKQAEKIVLMHSEDDFVVPYEHVLGYKKAWSTAELITYTDKNHFLLTDFPELIDNLKTLTGGTSPAEVI